MSHSAVYDFRATDGAAIDVECDGDGTEDSEWLVFAVCFENSP
jgi:hypothetical protein